jgi:hypothetical protein
VAGRARIDSETSRPIVRLILGRKSCGVLRRFQSPDSSAETASGRAIRLGSIARALKVHRESGVVGSEIAHDAHLMYGMHGDPLLLWMAMPIAIGGVAAFGQELPADALFNGGSDPCRH